LEGVGGPFLCCLSYEFDVYNNAFLSLYRLYSDDIPRLRSHWERRCGSDLRRFMEAAKALANKGDVNALMRAETASG
jgi:hypothetical protein